MGHSTASGCPKHVNDLQLVGSSMQPSCCLQCVLDVRGAGHLHGSPALVSQLVTSSSHSPVDASVHVVVWDLTGSGSERQK